MHRVSGGKALPKQGGLKGLGFGPLTSSLFSLSNSKESHSLQYHVKVQEPKSSSKQL